MVGAVPALSLYHCHRLLLLRMRCSLSENIDDADAGYAFRCVLTYEVQFSSSNTSNSFERINDRDTIFTSFLYDLSLEHVSGLF